MKIRDVMTRSAIVVSAEATAEEAAAKMLEADIGSLPVYGGAGAPCGIITDRDIALKVVAAGKGVATQVGEICTLAAVTVEPEAEVEEAVELMKRHQVRRLPVVRGDVVEGMISLGDIALAVERLGGEVLASVCGPPAPA